MVKRAVAAILMCAVMVIVAAVPLAVASTHIVLKGDQGPRASAVTWEYVPADYGIWTGHIVNNGLRSLTVDVYDNTTGAMEQISHQRIRFAAYGAYPTGVVDTEGVVMAPTHKYLITVTPSGPKGSSCTVNDPSHGSPPVAVFAATIDYLTLRVDGSASYDADGWIVSYSWDFGDGSSATGATANHTYAAGGVYTIMLTVTDNDGLTGSTSMQLGPPPPPHPPVANFTVSVGGMSVGVDGSASYDVDGIIVSYAWDFGDGSHATGVTANHSYAYGGTYTITLTVTDNVGQIGSTSKNVSLPGPPIPPVAVFTWSALDRLIISVNGSDSYDPDGVIVSYAWDFGDGLSATGMTSTHTYATHGTYTVTLTVTDNLMMVGSASESVTIDPTPPVLPVFVCYVDGLTVAVDASASSDPDGTIVSYAWTWGDGTIGAGVTATHTYAAPGNYTITLTMTDNDGRTYSTSKDVTVPPVPKAPVARFTATIAYLTIAVNGSASYDADGTIVAYDWDFGDGGSATGVTATHTYAAYGTWTITLKVTDNSGMTNSTTMSVTVSPPPPQPPVASFTCTTNNLTVAVNASESFDPDGTISSYAWTWGDGTTGTGVTATHTYATAGAKTITLTVTDNSGMTNSISKTPSWPPGPPPVAMFTVSVNGMKVIVDGSGSYDADGTIVSYAWDFGDGTKVSGITANHTYAALGVYTITLTVTDSFGLTGSASKQVVVDYWPPPPPTFVCQVNGLTAAVEAYGFDIVSCFWDWGDGSNGTGMTANHTYANYGDKTITMTATDTTGRTYSVSKTVTLYP